MWDFIDTFCGRVKPFNTLNDCNASFESQANSSDMFIETSPQLAPPQPPLCNQRTQSRASDIAIADLQGYWRNGDFVLKTLALLRLPATLSDNENYKVQLYSFLPPCGVAELNACDRRTKNWIEKHHHRTPWHCGRIDYSSRHEVIHRAVDGVSKIFVKGGQKADWLRPYVNCFVIDLHIFKCPPISRCVKDFREWHRSDVAWCTMLSLISEKSTQHVLALIHWITERRPDLLQNNPVRQPEMKHPLPL